MHMTLQAPRLSRLLSRFDNLAFLVTAIATLFGAIGWSDWVTFIATVYMLVTSLKDYLKLQERLTSTNTGLKDVRNLIVWWDSLSVVQKRTRASRIKAVGVTEEAMLR